MGQIIILIFVILFILIWMRLRKGESVNRLYQKLDIEPVFVGKYTDAYDSVSHHIAENEYKERAKSFHDEFRYEVVKYMNTELYGYKLKSIFTEVKSKQTLKLEELPEELQAKTHEIAERLVTKIKELSKPKSEDPSKSRRRRRR